MSKIPKLRFKEFSGDWEESKLGDLGNFQGGGTPSTINENYWTGNIPWISSSDIIDDDILNINIKKCINEISIKESATKIIPKNSILFVSRVGVGKLAISKNDLCTSQDFTNLTLSNDNSYFIGYYFLSNRNLLIRYSQGTSIKGFTTNDIKTLKLNLPQKQEQEKIASFLTSIDTKIEQLTQKETLLKKYKKGVMQKIFSKEIRFKADDGSEFCEWEEKTLKDISKQISYGLTIRPEYIKNGIPLISARELKGGRINYAIAPKISENSYNILSSKAKANKGDIFLTKTGTVGLSAYVNEDFPIAITQNIAVIRVDNKLYNHQFILQLFKTKHFYKNIIKKVNQSTIMDLQLQDIRKTTILLPSMKEQTKISNFLSSIDTKIEQTQKQLKQTKEFKKALLQQMFV